MAVVPGLIRRFSLAIALRVAETLLKYGRQGFLTMIWAIHDVLVCTSAVAPGEK